MPSGNIVLHSLAVVFLELLMQKDCYLRALRALLREIVRALRHEINLQAFCAALMHDRSKEQLLGNFEFKAGIVTLDRYRVSHQCRT